MHDEHAYSIETYKKLSSLFVMLDRVIASHDVSRVEVVAKDEAGSQLVSSLDMALEEQIIAFLREHYEECAIVSEEQEASWPLKGDRFWIIDPLDGTHNFLLGLPTYGTMFALVESGKAVMSVIYLPTARRAYVAGVLQGAWCYNLHTARCERLTVSSTDDITAALLLFEGSAKRILSSPSFRNIASSVLRVRTSLSMAWSATRLISRRHIPLVGDAMISYDNKPWDNLPACLLVEEAGGRVTDFEGRPWSGENCSSLLFSNGYLHDQALDLIKRK